MQLRDYLTKTLRAGSQMGCRFGFLLLVMVLLAEPGAASAQEVLRGTVVDSRSLQPISAASVMVEGTTLGTLTDAQGRFQIQGVTGQEVTLRAQRLGFRPTTAEVQVGDPNIRLALTQSAIELDEVVVTGTAGATQRRAIGNVVAQIDATERTQTTPIASAGDLLQAQSPGVVVQPGSGIAGAGPRIRIRGAGSLSLGTQPLIYIDGVRVDNSSNTGSSAQGMGIGSRLNDIDPSQIASMEIIKGPAAATLYGTEASSGVIQIITKKGNAGDGMRFEIATRQGTSWMQDPVGRFPTNYWRYADGRMDSINVIQEEKERGLDVFTPGYLQGYSAGLSGGSSLVRYFFGVGYDRDEGVEPTNIARRTSARANLSMAPHPLIDINTSLGVVAVNNNLPRQSSPTNGVVPSALRARAFLREGPTRGWFGFPPEVLWGLESTSQEVDKFTTSVNATHRPTRWFTHRATVGVDRSAEHNVNMREYAPPNWAPLFSASAARGYRNINDRTTTNLTVDYSATGRADVRENLTSSTSVGLQYYRKLHEFASAVGNEFPAPGITTISAAARTSASDFFVENATLGVYVQEQLEWNNRLFLTAAVRADDNSAFGQNFELVTYPKVSASWVVSEESFWSVGFVNAFRVRAAYGASGKQPDAYAALRLYSPVTGTGDLPAVTPGAFGNPDLAPERGEELETGFEVSLFDDRLGVNFTYFNARTTDAILQRGVAPSTGFSGYQFVNAGEIKNSGVELAINSQLYQGPAIGVGLDMNFSTTRSEIVNLGGLEEILIGGETYHRVGYAPYSFFFRRVVSADLDANGQAINVLCDDGGGGGIACAEAPRVYGGNYQPDFEGAIKPTISLFNRVQLTASVDFQLGLRKFAADNWGRCSFYRICRSNFFPEEFSPEEVAEVQLAGSSNILSHYYGKADFAKLRELSVSYALPSAVLSRFGLSEGNITLAGRHLHTWTGWPGLDPESVEDGIVDGAVVRYPSGRVHEQGLIPQLASFQMMVRLVY